MITATELKNGTTFEMDGKPYIVQKFAHQKIARGGGTVKLSLRNLSTGKVEEKTFNSTVKFDEIDTAKRRLQFLYNDGENAVFMTPDTYEQIEIPLDIVGDQIVFIKEGEEANVLFWEGKALSVEIPPSVIATIAETDPGVKGNSASNMYKSAKLDNGLDVRVPLFIKTGDKIKVDTRTFEYLERANTSK